MHELSEAADVLAERLRLEGCPDVVGTEQAARLLCVSETALRNWIYRGRVRAYKHGKNWRIPVSSLMDLIERGAPEARRLIERWRRLDAAYRAACAFEVRGRGGRDAA